MGAERFLADRLKHHGATDDRRKMLALAATVDDVINLGRGDPDLETPGYIMEAAKEGLDKHMTHYTAWAGLPELRRAVAKKFQADGIACDPNTDILITVGAQEAIFLTMQSILNPGDEVIVPEPRYTPYDTCITLAGGKMVSCPTYAEDGFQVRAENIERVITEKTKAILLVSPNNPTGAVADRATVETVAGLARSHDLMVISDELYGSLLFDGTVRTSMASLPGMRERTVTVSGVSKTYSMTGWRIGFLCAPKEIIDPMLSIKYAVTICATAIAQYAALAALENPRSAAAVEEIVRTYDQRRRVAMKRLDQAGIEYTVPKGSFYVFCSIKKYGMSSFEFASSLLKETGVFTFPGTCFGDMGEGFIRLSLLVPTEKIEEAFDRIERYLKARGL